MVSKNLLSKRAQDYKHRFGNSHSLLRMRLTCREGEQSFLLLAKNTENRP